MQVATGTTTVAESIPLGVEKLSGMTAHAGRPAVSAASRVKKRSLLRARKRAAKDPFGLAWYRGRLVSSTQLGCITPNTNLHSLPLHDARHTPPFLSNHNNRPRVQPRIRVATLNVGGFDQVTYDTFMQFLTSSHCKLDVICVQEIHFGLGKSSREWSASGWHVVTSVSTRFAGLAFFVRSSKWDEQATRYKAYVQGRLMHLRLDCSGFAADFVGVYQHARPQFQQAGTSSVLEQRAKIWVQMRDLLASLPKRNLLVVLGGLNTNLRTARGIAGPGTLKPCAPHKDQRELQALLQEFGLCALNTWSLPAAQQATNIGPDSSTQIDFVLVHRQHADQLARTSRPVSDLNFSPWRSGQRHLMVDATLPFFPGWRKPAQPNRSLDGASLRQSVAHGDEKSLILRDRFQTFLSQQANPSVQDLNTALLDIAKDLYPAQRAKRLAPAWAQDTVRGANAALQAQQQLLQGRTCPRLGAGFLADVFHGFRQVCILLSKARAARQAAKQARQLRLDAIMQDAERASKCGDIHLL